MPPEPATDGSLPSTLRRLTATLPGGSFAFVMATGIVSIACGLQGLDQIATALSALDLVAFVILSLMMLLRLARYPGAVLNELSHHRTAPGFLTIVAAAAVLGNELALQTTHREIAAGLWLVGCGLWALLIYTFFSALTIRLEKVPLGAGLDGTWLLVVVASEALTILGSHVASVFTRADIVVYLSLCWFLLGGFFYLIIIGLIMYRWLFEPMRSEQLTPPYWINMGAVAIATLAGSRLESIAGAYPLVMRLLPAIAVMTVLFWTVATWWIPLLLALTIWRHTAGGIRLSYGLEHWSMVFPLGMYTAATWTFSHDNGLDFLYWIPQVFVWFAVAAWVAGFAGMVRRGLRGL